MLTGSEVVLVGYSGHGYVVGEAAITAGMKLLYYVDIQAVKQNPFELEYLGTGVDGGFTDWKKGTNILLV